MGAEGLPKRRYVRDKKVIGGSIGENSPDSPHKLSSSTDPVTTGCEPDQGNSPERTRSRHDGVSDSPGPLCTEWGVAAPWVIAVDTEGSGLYADDGARVSVVSWAWRDSEGQIQSRALPFGQGKPNLLEADDAGLSEWDNLMMTLSAHHLVMHNAAHDLPQLAAGSVTGHYGCELGNRLAWDTMVCQRHLDPLESIGLDDVGARLLGTPKDPTFKEYLKKHRMQKTYHLVPWHIMEPYAKRDAEVTLRLFELQWRRIVVDGEWPDLEWLQREFEVTKCLYRMEQRGIGFNAAACLDAAYRLEHELVQLATELPFKPSSLAQAKAYYFNTLKIPHHKTTDGGQPSLDEEVRRELIKNGAPHAVEYDHWCQLETALSMWYQAWPTKIGTDGRLRTRYRQTKVVSGRFSVERVQLQAIPHDYRLAKLPDGIPLVRSFFEPAHGKQLWEMDLSQAEVRVATWYSRCKAMKEAIENGEDAHDATTRLIFGIDKSDPDWKRLRAVAKRIRLGTIYGGGAGKIQGEIKRMEGLDLPLEQVREWIEIDRKRFPEFVQAAYRAQRLAERDGFVKLARGGLRWFTELERRWDSHKAFNQVIQGSVASVMNDWMLAVEATWPGVLLLQIHDSLIVECDEADEETPMLAAKLGEQIFADVFEMPFVSDVKTWP